MDVFVVKSRETCFVGREVTSIEDELAVFAAVDSASNLNFPFFGLETLGLDALDL